jgi:hypothetical protein
VVRPIGPDHTFLETPYTLPKPNPLVRAPLPMCGQPAGIDPGAVVDGDPVDGLAVDGDPVDGLVVDGVVVDGPVAASAIETPTAALRPRAPTSAPAASSGLSLMLSSSLLVAKTAHPAASCRVEQSNLKATWVRANNPPRGLVQRADDPGPVYSARAR